MRLITVAAGLARPAVLFLTHQLENIIEFISTKFTYEGGPVLGRYVVSRPWLGLSGYSHPNRLPPEQQGNRIIASSSEY